MFKLMLKQTSFWLAITNFILALLFVYRGGMFNQLISFIWFLNFFINLTLTSKEVRRHE